jgi:hypothetical protein
MAKKLIVQILDESGNVTSETKYKSIKDIQKKYPSIEYHQLRAVHSVCKGKELKRQHEYLKVLMTKFKIIDDYENPLSI